MKIGIFALETGRKVGGLEVYETNLIRALAQIDERNEYLVFCLSPDVPEILDLRSKNFSFQIIRTNRLKGVLWDAPRAMAQARLDLFHAVFVPPPFVSVPYVFTCHGSEVVERPDFYPFFLGLRMRLLFLRAFKKAGLIICVSDFVRSYLANQCGISQERLRTVHLAFQSEFRPIDPALARPFLAQKYGLNKPFVLTVGRLEPRKNPIRVLKAYDRFRRSVDDPPMLAMAGMKTWSANEIDRTIKELELQGMILQLGHVPHVDLPMFYAASEFALYASLWEGFGLPVVEAFASGTPLITSRVTSLPEVGGKACLYVDPYNVEEIAYAMRQLHCDPNLRQKLAREGIARSVEFTWQRTARETLKVYQDLANRLKKAN